MLQYFTIVYNTVPHKSGHGQFLHFGRNRCAVSGVATGQSERDSAVLAHGMTIGRGTCRGGCGSTLRTLLQSPRVGSHGIVDVVPDHLGCMLLATCTTLSGTLGHLGPENFLGCLWRSKSFRGWNRLQNSREAWRLKWTITSIHFSYLVVRRVRREHLGTLGIHIPYWNEN